MTEVGGVTSRVRWRLLGPGLPRPCEAGCSALASPSSTLRLTCDNSWSALTLEASGAPLTTNHADGGRTAMVANNSTKPSLSERFWSKVRKLKPHECWEWQASRVSAGYGKISLPHSRQLEGAHRVAWKLTNGPIPDGLFVLHRCDNPPCCNPSHLFLGTHADNMKDMTAKGRHKGRPSPGRLLTTDQVRRIKNRVRTGESRRQVARDLGKDHRLIARIMTGELYADIR